MRRFLIGSGTILAVLLAVALLGAAYESVSEAADARAYPPPGRDHSGVHLRSRGHGL